MHEELGRVLLESSEGKTRQPDLTATMLSVRREIAWISDQRADRLAPFGGSTLPAWFPHLRGEAKQLGRAVWLQLRPNVLPRFPALIGLAVGWWIANTYTSSHFKSVLHSLGIGSGGKRVVSGDTYRAMLFWLPIVAAGLGAYLADRAKYLVQRRYMPPVSEHSAQP